MTRFSDLHLIEPILRAVEEEGYEYPTPIQQQTIPHVLVGRDVLGCAQTGTGKTAAFALPLLQRLHEAPVPTPRYVRILILAPTRELASQIDDDFGRYGRHTQVRSTVVYGGVGQQPQADALRRGVDVLVATPGRLLDLMQQRIAHLDRVQVLILDEADRMLDMGFIHDVRRIIAALPKKRQTLFFSATLPLDILGLAHDILSNPVRVEVTPAATTVEKITQSLYHVERHDKFRLLAQLLRDRSIRRVLIFTRTKRGANKLAEQLNRGVAHADAIHGNKGQSARERALENFKRGSCRVLVATDIAARGIDVDDITHVVNYDLPDVPENYVHRIGRTARAGAEGAAITLCGSHERQELSAIEKLIRMRIPVQPPPSAVSAPTRPFEKAAGGEPPAGMQMAPPQAQAHPHHPTHPRPPHPPQPPAHPHPRPGVGRPTHTPRGRHRGRRR